MSYALEAFLTTTLQADAALVAMLGQRPDGVAEIYPYHHRDVSNPNYPIVTISRFGSRVRSDMFSDTIFATIMDAPKLAICVWARDDVDQAMKPAVRIRQIINDQNFSAGNANFAGFRLVERSMRDDLFDDVISAYHVHIEYDGWIQERVGNPQPIGV